MFYPADGFTKTFEGYEPPDRVLAIRVNDVDVLGASINGTATVNGLASALETQVDGYTSSPEYTSRAVDNRVFIVADSTGTEPNGFDLEVEVLGDIVIGEVLDMNGGVDPDELDGATSEPGTFVKTYGSKMYTVSGPVLHFSGIGQPTIFNSEATGAGFIDMTTYASGSDELRCMENYFGQMAIFARDTIQLWSLDPNPDLNQQEQVIRNQGTIAPNSAIQVGEMDLFFLSDTGIMTIRPHGVTTDAQIETASLPIDDVVQAKIEESAATAERAVAVIEPKTKSFWLSIGDTIYVLSRYPSVNIAAWSVYEVDGGDIDAMLVFDGSVYIRQGNTIKQYGGATGDVYDSSKVTVWIPYLDAQKPADWKTWDNINMAADGDWVATPYTDPDDTTQQDAPVDISSVTYGKTRIPIAAHSTHLSIKMEHEASGYARISNFAAHFDAGESG